MSKGTKNLFVNAILLSITMMIMKVIGIIFKVYISNEIGTEGMGLYKLIGTVSMIAITFATSGISSAVTRVVSEEVSKRAYGNIKYVIFKSCTICGILGILMSIILMFFSENIAYIFLKERRVILSLKIMALSIPFISISSCLKGYFFAVRDIFIPITTQLAEKFIQIAVVVSLLSIAVPMGLEYGCAVLVLGTVVSEVLSCLYVFIVYQLEKRENKEFSIKATSTKGLLKRVFEIAVPVASNSYLMVAFSSIEMILIPLSLVKFGMSRTEAISTLGGVMGMVFPIIMFPAVLLMSVGRILIPEIARAKAINNNERINSIINRSINLTCILGIISFFIFFNFYNQLSISIYNREDIGIIFRMVSFIIPFMYISMILGGVLNGLNEQVKSLEYQIIESIVTLIGIYFLVPIKGVDGLIITMFISVAISFVLSFYRIIKVVGLRIDLLKWVIKPLIFGTVAVIFGKLLWSILVNNSLAIGINTFIVITCILIVYFILLKAFNCIKIRD